MSHETGFSFSLLQRSDAARGYALVSPALLVAAGTLLLPLCILLIYSFWTQNDLTVEHTWVLDNYRSFLANTTYLAILGKSVLVSLAATLLVLIFSYPVAAFIALRVKKHKALLLLIITIPFWTSYLLRVFAWKIILGYNGVINSGLIWLGIIDQPLEILLYNPYAVVITLAHAWAPFALLPIFISLEKIDRSLLEAARDLGDGAWHSFWRVLLPLSRPGLIAAGMLVFIPTVGDYVTPQLVGGTSGMMIGNVVQSMFGRTNNWPMGAAISIVTMVVVTLIACLVLWRAAGKSRETRK
ncbi:ABC transporter permease [Pseudaminobacter sp. NGMCC 1.201702]|uniref:ABC transporter permease n=1 Tax=Pseudaminobacter sp. NGMCC 1.201702 TaxID=3391825 RepID=UPI0039F05127